MSEWNSVEHNSIQKACYRRKWDVILNKEKDYYENDKERLREHAGYKYRNWPEEEKKDRNHNMSEENKQRLKEYQKTYREAKNSQCNNQQNSFFITI